MKKIKVFLSKFRKKYVSITVIKNICKLFIFFLISFIVLCFVEELFYLNSENRKLLFSFFIIIFGFLLLYNVVFWILEYFSILNSCSDEKYAKMIGENFNKIKDRLVNILQINKNSSELDLAKLATKNINENLEQIDSDIFFKSHFNYNKISYLILFALTLIILIQIFLINPASRIINYDKDFNQPLPFMVSSSEITINAHYNDSIFVFFNIDTTFDKQEINMKTSIFDELSSLINFNKQKYIPDSINLHWENHKGHFIKKIPYESGNYSHTFNKIKSNTIYWVEYKPTSLFSPWDSIGTIPSKIQIIETPQIENIEFQIIPPAYSQLEPVVINGEYASDIDVLIGSNIHTTIISNKDLKFATLILNEIDTINLEITNNMGYTKFYFDKDTTLKVNCIDLDDVTNINPIEYSFNEIRDYPPSIIVNSPDQEFILDESYNIELNLNISDDFGITNLEIEYFITSQDGYENNIYKDTNKITLNNHIINNKSINIFSPWDVSNLPISMGDEIHFWINARDNNAFNESITKSNIFIGKFPSFEDLFTQIEDYEEESNNSLNEIEDTISDILDETQQNIKNAKKYNNLSFEEEKKVEDAIEEIKDIYEEIEDIQNNINKILEQAEKNNLFDKDLMEKFEYFYEMLAEIMTDELRAAIENLQNEMKGVNPEDMIKALENFEFNVEQLEQELNRFIDMFELAKAEQKLNELSESIENILEKEADLINELNDEEFKQSLLSAKSQKQEHRFDDFSSLIEETSKVIESISPEIADRLNQLNNDKIIPETQNELNMTTQNIKENKSSNATQNANTANDNLKALEESIDQIKENFQNETMEDMLSDFIAIIDNLIIISMQQEQLINESKELKSSSPLLREINFKQKNIEFELEKVLYKLLLLSNKTFFITPKISRSFGSINSELKNIITNFAQKKIGPAKNSQINVSGKINDTILLLLEALNEMQSSETLSGFEQFLESMQTLTEKQQGINQGTMQLPQFGPSQQQSILNELLKRQQQIKEQLEELLGENPGSNPGEVETLLEDLEDVIRDFKNNNITQETIDRQDGIVSKMLDYQKSLEKKDYSNRRESNTANESLYIGPKGLPDNLGDKNLLLINAMESAMDEGYSNEYNKRIRNYFLNLQKSNEN